MSNDQQGVVDGIRPVLNLIVFHRSFRAPQVFNQLFVEQDDESDRTRSPNCTFPV
jgi:hypothetical protein